jgi:hypothetical protein
MLGDGRILHLAPATEARVQSQALQRAKDAAQ